LYVGRAGQGPLEVREVVVLLADICREGRRECSKTLLSDLVLAEETRRGGAVQRPLP
jgi:hypothetical protein